MATLVDTNVLVDVAVRDPDWHSWSLNQLFAAAGRGAVIINQIIYSEFSYRYDDPDEVERLLPETEFLREGLPWPAAFAAAQAFRLYRAGGGKKERVLPDFLIGAHAAIRGYPILTRDPSGYRSYFPMVELITPETHPMKDLTR
ncbi:type II toxin-antitoxin system VapC family toxin [Rhizobium sp. LC145]|uniref:type II toxin-antitoxin system VapC family toxin n=1 Tax=Rhizobium sp. LC145 TaxID=1120688 RepID=UPI00062A1096|nr:type II toxin-antitoxin system VapC family toxin [Rhizobium sp. LC145]KKX30403.1 DNA-binding protein [Rhizobium sp. LC145]TKT46470.1 type II toxin-antitoxin system VapC family toxin [Rhizobiaceae bacterium LC148]